jgi:hypothetical protein
MGRITIPRLMTVVLAMLSLVAGITGSWGVSLQNTYEVEGVSPQATLDPRLSDILTSINTSLVSRYLEDLVAIGPRMTGQPGCDIAAEYIAEQFEDMGLIAYTQVWQSFGNRWHPGYYSGRNVVGELPGSDSTGDAIIIFNAHYDTVRNTPGADDDASGVAAVLAAAHVLSQYTFLHTVKFIAFSGEEVGLLGSHAYAHRAYDSGEAIALEFNADMIGHGNGANASKFRVYGTEDAAWAMDTIAHLNKNTMRNFTLTSGIIGRSNRGGSDYASFAHYGYETIAFFEYEWNPHMHTPEDTLEKVNISYLVNTTRLIAIALADFAGLVELPVQVIIDRPVRGALNVNGNQLLTLSSSRILMTIAVGNTVVSVTQRFGDESVDRVEFFLDDELVHSDGTEPYSWTVDQTLLGLHEVKATLYTLDGTTTTDILPVLFATL